MKKDDSHKLNKPGQQTGKPSYPTLPEDRQAGSFSDPSLIHDPLLLAACKALARYHWSDPGKADISRIVGHRNTPDILVVSKRAVPALEQWLDVAFKNHTCRSYKEFISGPESLGSEIPSPAHPLQESGTDPKSSHTQACSTKKERS
jgi:hypothetical protein